MTFVSKSVDITTEEHNIATLPDFTEHIWLLIYAKDNKIKFPNENLENIFINTINFGHLMFLINC